MRPQRQSNDTQIFTQTNHYISSKQSSNADFFPHQFYCNARRRFSSLVRIWKWQELLMASKPFHKGSTQASPCTVSNIFTKEKRNVSNLLDQIQNCRKYKLIPYLGFQFLGFTIMYTESPENAAQSFLQTFPSLLIPFYLQQNYEDKGFVCWLWTPLTAPFHFISGQLNTILNYTHYTALIPVNYPHFSCPKIRPWTWKCLIFATETPFRWSLRCWTVQNALFSIKRDKTL